MELIVHELESSLEQGLTASKNTIVTAIRPHLYRHTFADGSLKMQIVNESDEVIAESNTVAIADIESAQPFYHGHIRFDISAFLAKGTTYKFRLVAVGGYEFSESAFIGWCNSYDLATYPSAFTPPTSFHSALALEVWERTEK